MLPSVLIGPVSLVTRRPSGTVHPAAVFGDRIVLQRNRPVPDPVGLRYLYAEPWYGSLMNEVGLPLGPFRIDARSTGVK